MNFKSDVQKPAYSVPSMEQIKTTPWNGYNVVSTFSGAGGSCLGYRMAGYKVRWANEFIPAAQEVYKLNHPDSTLDTRDIRTVKPEDILQATGLQAGDIDLFDGSPPCASFSTAGKRAKAWGEVKQYSDTKQRVDDLFFEYARLIDELQPKVFVAENVSGLVKGVAKGYFKLILQSLRDCGYKVEAKLLDAQWLGVPQMRQRIIFVGVRNDLDAMPTHPKPLPYRYVLQDALRNLDAVVEPETDISNYSIGNLWDEIKPGQSHPVRFGLKKQSFTNPCHAITQTMATPSGATKYAAAVVHPLEKRYFSISELKRICAFPDDFMLTGTWAQQWERLGRSVPPVMMMHIAKTIQHEILDTL